VSGQDDRAQPQFADPDYSPPQAPQPNTGGAAPRMPAQPRPTQTVTNNAQNIVEVIDSRHRRIAIKKLGVLDRMRLFEGLGSTLSENTAYLTYALTIACVTKIERNPVPFPSKKTMLEAHAT
jgi:hypothetical protein